MLEWSTNENKTAYWPTKLHRSELSRAMLKNKGLRRGANKAPRRILSVCVANRGSRAAFCLSMIFFFRKNRLPLFGIMLDVVETAGNAPAATILQGSSAPLCCPLNWCLGHVSSVLLPIFSRVQ